MARRYLQTGTAPSPAAGGASELASLGGPVNVGSAAAPTIGQLMTATGGSAANWANPPASGVVDDPTVRTSNFTAVAFTRYFINSNSTVTVFMPAMPADGDIVAVCGIGNSIGSTTINGNGANFQLANTITSPLSFGTRNLDLAFRYTTATGQWESIDTSVSSLLSYGAPLSNTVVGSDGAGYAARVQLSNGDSVPGRVQNFEIQELRPWMQAHNLFGNYSDNSVYDTQTGTVAQWTPGSATPWYRAMLVQWDGAADLVVRSLKASPTSSDFRQDKILWNSTTNRVLTLNHIDSGAPLGGSESLYITGASGFAADSGYKYRVAPGEFVRLVWNPNQSAWLVLAPVRNGGLTVDAKVQTTAVAPTLLHTYTTSATVSPTSTERIYAYKVRVQAIKTVGTTVGDAALFDIAALFYRNTAGTVVVKDVVFINGPYKDAGAAAWDVTFTISGSDIQMNVVGDAVDTIRWRVTGNITEHG